MSIPFGGTPRRFTVGDLEVDIGLQRVTRGGVDLPLPKLSFDLLVALAEAAPNFVSHRELLARVWDGLVVADKTVNQRVKLLRDALGDDPDSPRYIASLRGRGYRLLTPVAPVGGTAPGVGGAAADSVAAPPEPGHAPRRLHASARLRRARWLAPAAIAAGIAVAWFLGPVQPPAPGPSGGAPAAVVAVLPFRAVPGNAFTDAMGQGIAEGVLERLAPVPGIEVIARDSAFSPRVLDLDSQAAAERLGAAFVLEGVVSRTGDTLSVTARLLDAARGAELWAAKLDRPVDEVFALEDEIARRAEAALRGERGTVAAAPARRPTDDVDAYLSYLRGRALVSRWTAAEARAAEAELTDAIARDPTFAAAYAWLYDARLLEADRASGGATPNAKAGAFGESPLGAARAANDALIERALALDPRNGAAYLARAIWAPSDSEQREQDFRTGLALDPSNGRGIVAFAEFLDRTGRAAEAEQWLDRAVKLDPISPRAHFVRVMRAFPTDPFTTEEGLKRVLEIDPSYQPALQRFAKYRWMLHGDFGGAIRTLDRALELDPGNPWITYTAVAMRLDAGDVAGARELLARTTHPELGGALLVALYDGDVAGAGAIAFTDAAFANGKFENWGVYEAVRDSAALTGESGRALDYLARRTGLRGEAPAIDLQNFRAVPAVAQLLMLAGRDAEARALALAAVDWVDTVHVPTAGTVYALRVKATALALLGERSLALDALDASFRGGDYLQWWYTLERDPIWAPLRSELKFAEIAQRVHEHVAAQRGATESPRRP